MASCCVIDETLTPSTDVDLFRIKIWDKDSGDVVVYDNQTDAAEDADLTTAIGGGNIVIHDKQDVAAVYRERGRHLGSLALSRSDDGTGSVSTRRYNTAPQKPRVHLHTHLL